MHTDELLDIVNEYDQVIGQKYRSEIHQQKTNNFRGVNAFLVNNKKELWIPRRSAHKKLFPLCLDASVSGLVAAGETYEYAFERELREELNLELSHVSYTFLTKLNPAQHNVSCHMHLYIINTNTSPCYNLDDFIGGTWVSIQELQNTINNGEPAKGDLPKLVEVLKNLI